ncbi:anti-sigma factor [Streptacidiphilus jiangxiensis]|uniref:Regulator of SigK n=1 Tax=Streptacidiphilus jiangxiensis TaxID=235985 RepID=A0A1H7N4B9_STRJI|nr:anti-sigma factor [Streptacidiphilus jiangxiensis]SEL17795.1 Putative zinc-finger [Streptacidiphilus jiangxiensis]
MTAADLHMLAGAYALGALDEDERRAFEAHLADCEACAVEVAEFVATSARLALAASQPPPAAMKQQVLGRIAEVRQEPPKVDLPAPRPSAEPSRVRRGARFALAASIAAAVGLGGVAAWQYERAQDAHQQAQQAQAETAQIAAVLSAPDAHATVGAVAGAGQGARATVVTSRTENRAVFLTPGLPDLPSGHTYQLWFNDAGVMRPAGLVTPGAADQTILLKGPIGPASGMGITVEPVGGSLHPTTAPIALMPFAAT